MTQAYSDPSRENEPFALPDVEIFYLDGAEETDEDGEPFATVSVADAPFIKERNNAQA